MLVKTVNVTGLAVGILRSTRKTQGNVKVDTVKTICKKIPVPVLFFRSWWRLIYFIFFREIWELLQLCRRGYQPSSLFSAASVFSQGVDKSPPHPIHSHLRKKIWHPATLRCITALPLTPNTYNPPPTIPPRYTTNTPWSPFLLPLLPRAPQICSGIPPRPVRIVLGCSRHTGGLRGSAAGPRDRRG